MKGEKMKSLYRQTYKGIGRLMMACLCVALVACGEDETIASLEEEQTEVSALTPESFIVEYALSEGESTRAALLENLPANKRIRSLRYLLYDSDGMLRKEREISDINEQTQWPLTRDNMTWAQREALKDTLISTNVYTAIFIANVTEDLLKEKKQLRSFRLCLPNEAFRDDNMIYLWKEKICYEKPQGAADTEDTRKHPLTKQILLRRILSRIDVSQISLSDDLIKQALSVDYRVRMKESLQKEMGELTDLVQAKLANQFSSSLCKTLRAKLTDDVKLENIIDQAYGSYQDKIVEIVKKEEAYLKRTKEWGSYSSSTFQIQNTYNSFSLDTLAGGIEEPQIATSSYDMQSGKAVWVGFSANVGKHSTTEDTEGVVKPQLLTGIQFYEGTTASELISFATPADISNIPKNERREYVCNPIASIASTAYTDTYSFTVDMSRYYGAIQAFVSLPDFDYSAIPNGVAKEEFEKAITEAVNEKGGWGNLGFTSPIAAAGDFRYSADLTLKK